MEQKSKIPINEILTVAAELLSDEPPKTFMGRVRMWFKKIVRLKNSVGVKIKI